MKKIIGILACLLLILSVGIYYLFLYVIAKRSQLYNPYIFAGIVSYIKN